MKIKWDKVHAAAAAAKLLQSCLTLCDPIDGSPPIPGILQAKTLEWVAISFSNAWKWKVKVKSLSRVWLLATPWTAAYQAPPSMGFSRQEYWSGVPLPSPDKVHTILKQFLAHSWLSVKGRCDCVCFFYLITFASSPSHLLMRISGLNSFAYPFFPASYLNYLFHFDWH